MLRRKDSAYKEIVDTLVGTNTVFEGNIESEGTVKVEGKIKGDLKVKGDVFIGTDAVVSGDISADNIHLSGKVEGSIHATGILRILSTAKLHGDIRVKSFVADEGALFDGKCSMLDTQGNEESIEKTSIKKSQKENKKSAVDEVIDKMKEDS